MKPAKAAPSVGAVCVGLAALAATAAEPLTFGVVPQRTAALTAQYWNPILNHVSARSGVALELRLDRSGPGTLRGSARAASTWPTPITT